VAPGLEETWTGYYAENKACFHRWKPREKSTYVYIAFFTLLKMYCNAKQC